MKMTPEQLAAFVISQASLLNAEIAAMQAANQQRAHRGESMAYDEEHFQKLMDSYRRFLRHDMVHHFFIRGEIDA